MVFVHAFATMPHYLDHIHPILDALPDGVRGRVTNNPGLVRRGDLVMVGGNGDAAKVVGRGARLIHVDHGAGQSYSGTDHASYPGGAGMRDIVAFLSPSRRVAEQWTATYPTAAGYGVGCPMLDRWAGAPRPSGRVVAVSFHWDCRICPETRWALPHHQRALEGLRDAVRASGGELLGHGHPRAWPTLRRIWMAMGVPSTPDLAEVLDKASLLVADNSSSLFEAAAVGMPVVCLNAPGYRREVEHGMRFWSHVPGAQVDEPGDLVDAVLAELDEPERHIELRRRAVQWAYDGAIDGQASARAAGLVLGLT